MCDRQQIGREKSKSKETNGSFYSSSSLVKSPGLFLAGVGKELSDDSNDSNDSHKWTPGPLQS